MYPSIDYIKSLSPEEQAEYQKSLQRAVFKKFLKFAALKGALYLAIAYSVKKACSDD